MAEHTKGPWIADEDGDIMTDGALIAHVFDAADFPCYEAEDQANEQRFREEMEANARLITAAPDLLAASKAALADANLNGDLAEDTLALLETAIAKAEGRGAVSDTQTKPLTLTRLEEACAAQHRFIAHFLECPMRHCPDGCEPGSTLLDAAQDAYQCTLHPDGGQAERRAECGG